MRKVRAMASEFQSGIDDLAREAELDDLKKSIEKTGSTDIAGELENQIDPTGEVTKSMREIETSLKEDPREESGTDEPLDKGEADAASGQASLPDAEGDVSAPAEGKKEAGGSA